MHYYRIYYVSSRNFFVDLLETLFSSIVVLFAIYMWVAMPEMVYGASMEPNFHTGERILVEKITKYFKLFDRGDIVGPGKQFNLDIGAVLGRGQDFGLRGGELLRGDL